MPYECLNDASGNEGSQHLCNLNRGANWLLATGAADLTRREVVIGIVINILQQHHQEKQSIPLVDGAQQQAFGMRNATPLVLRPSCSSLAAALLPLKRWP